ncbi:MAG: TIR domain-containing protein [Anaerolineaceae bacterium]|nr:TIR domain-containing protein [Anaerolineaceae bacterium]
MAPRVFISYRRADTQTMTERIYERLVVAFGRNKVFKDIGSIPAGLDFRQYIQSQLKGCKVMLVIIGPQWATVSDDSGLRRLNNPDDLVRVEVETALSRSDIPVIPILVPDGKTQIPDSQDLPEILKKLHHRNSLSVRHDPDFDSDMNRLIMELSLYLGRPRQARSRISFWQIIVLLGVLSLLILGATLLYLQVRRELLLPTQIAQLTQQFGQATAMPIPTSAPRIEPTFTNSTNPSPIPPTIHLAPTVDERPAISQTIYSFYNAVNYKDYYAMMALYDSNSPNYQQASDYAKVFTNPYLTVYSTVNQLTIRSFNHFEAYVDVSITLYNSTNGTSQNGNLSFYLRKQIDGSWKLWL